MKSCSIVLFSEVCVSNFINKKWFYKYRLILAIDLYAVINRKWNSGVYFLICYSGKILWPCLKNINVLIKKRWAIFKKKYWITSTTSLHPSIYQSLQSVSEVTFLSGWRECFPNQKYVRFRNSAGEIMVLVAVERAVSRVGDWHLCKKSG